ncbi:22109_t:CDS:2 [Entrophospora sp. SA101]|nr:22109_t:CDS:2 [Entrophospora sp. SA101]
MNEATYTATWIAPDFELLKGNEPDLFTSSWCEMVHPSSKWRRQLVYGSNKKASRKCDGALRREIDFRKQGELWRVCLAGKDKYLVEKIYKLEIPWKFEDDWFKLEDTCKMLLLIEKKTISNLQRLPYIALFNKNHTSASDVYSIGIIMAKLETPPFSGYELISKISTVLGPDFVPGMPGY